MRVGLVVNPTSGRRRGEALAARVRTAFRGAGHQVVPFAGGAVRQTHLDRVVVVGGDGAVHRVLPALLDLGVPVGLVPAGTGNDFARALGLPHDDVDACLDVALHGVERRIDVAQTSAGPVLTVVAAGFDSRVNERANAMRWPSGPRRYDLAIVVELRTFQPQPMRIVLDDPRDGGAVIERGVTIAAVGNGSSFGGGLRICPEADLSDGLLDVVVVGPMRRRTLARLFPSLLRGTHLRHRQVELHRVRSVRLETTDSAVAYGDGAGRAVAYGDGERLGPLPLDVRIEPGALRVLVPADGVAP